MWEGPVGNWLDACDRILGMDVDAIVPGHGPLASKDQVRAVADYLAYIAAETRARFDAGMTAEDAALDIGLGKYAVWRDAERVAVNVDTLYREFAGSHEPANVLALFERMARLYYDRR
jgi:glyoxylase-like metal-dependent hydrolase (beta-lactamase superfamily II)